MDNWFFIIYSACTFLKSSNTVLNKGISKNTNNTSKINYNSETQIDSQIYKNSNYNFDERTLKQNHKFIPVKIIPYNLLITIAC